MRGTRGTRSAKDRPPRIVQGLSNKATHLYFFRKMKIIKNVLPIPMSSMSVIAHAWTIVQKDVPVMHTTVVNCQIFPPLLQPRRVHRKILQVYPLQVIPLQVRQQVRRQQEQQQLERQLNPSQLLQPQFLASVMICFKMKTISDVKTVYQLILTNVLKTVVSTRHASSNVLPYTKTS